MMNIIDKAYRKVFGTEIIRNLPATFAAYGAEPDSTPIKREILEVDVVIMSQWTERELMREDFNNSTGICGVRIHGEPVRIFGKRVVFDDSLGDGEFLVCERAY